MKLLELFSATGSVGKVARSLHWNVVPLDLKGADISCNILDWDYKQLPSGYFDMIWGSPPCTEYSIAKSKGVRKIDEAHAIVLKTLEIIKYFKPKVWFIENPQTGLLKKQTFMKDLHFVDVDYCKYGMPYRKRTRLWNNITSWQPRPLCKRDCGMMEGKRHKETAQRAPSGKKVDWKENFTLFKQSELYRIPNDLIEDILGSISVIFYKVIFYHIYIIDLYLSICHLLHLHGS